MKNKFSLYFTLILTAILTGCINDNISSLGSNNSSTLGGSTGTNATTTANGPQFTIVTANILQSTATPTPAPTPNPNANASPTPTPAPGVASTATAPTMQLFFNATPSTQTLNSVCEVQSGSSSNTGSSTSATATTPTSGSSNGTDPTLTCTCQYVWTETNTSSGGTVTRTVNTAPTQISAFQVQCPVPAVWTTEIADQTTVQISVVPSTNSGNNSGFTTNVWNYTYSATAVAGPSDFQDAEGNGYKNVAHYVCFDMFQRALSITHNSKRPFANNPSGQPGPMMQLANDFNLGTTATNSYSAQSYYYDFYVRTNELGSINSSNAGFTCPEVNINNVPSPYPMDSQFALAINPNTNFRVTVNSRTFIQTTSAPGSVLGYAALPNADGTCPPYADSTGKLRLTFRLRQYAAVYPIRYQATGDIADTSQPLNIIYVLDRPVDKAGQSPTNPITRLGPKACPFSYDTAQFGYKCTSDSTLAGWNIDGIQVTGENTCPIYPPPPDQWMQPNGTLVIKPYKPFTPHYLENTAFQACAFQSSVPTDPPMVLVHNETAYPQPAGPDDFYCAEYYPAAGSIIPAATGSSFNKAPGNCDLTTSAAAIQADQTFACSRTYDPTKNPISTPLAGCCQICSGDDCTAVGGGRTPAGRNAAYTPPSDAYQTMTPQPTSINLLPAASPNTSGQNGCFDPDEDTAP